jgi:hypothetical protein
VIVNASRSGTVGFGVCAQNESGRSKTTAGSQALTIRVPFAFWQLLLLIALLQIGVGGRLRT